MSRAGAPVMQDLDCHAVRVGVVAARWHERVMDGLIDGAIRALTQARVEAPTLLRVPGSFELPVAASALARSGHHAIVALGVVIRGSTPHFDYVCRAATEGLARVALDHDVPVGFGLLTCDDEQQALDRAGLPGSREDKGYDAAQAALVTTVAIGALRHP
ncbi:MAG TPA: 6,7-dimethyl-8-ribityllumazine synthase [Nocardioidaceae bacterium]|nr:6,7-dimethyl-8-ribityllumazine synthase [Nocardioidaceae bacterium]